MTDVPPPPDPINPASGQPIPPPTDMPIMPGSGAPVPPPNAPQPPPMAAFPNPGPGAYPPPTNYPPPSPAMAPVGTEVAPKKKRWPWIVAGVVLLCGLPLGGCIGLVAFGVNEIGERSDEIAAVADQFFQDVSEGDTAGIAAVVDGGSGCASSELIIDTMAQAEGSSWTREDVKFVERSDNGYLANGPDPETFVVPGRESESTAQVAGLLDDTSITVDLLKPDDEWLVCAVRNS